MAGKKTPEGGTRDRIISAALSAFMEKGYEETSVRTIIEGADATTGSFYHFFASKEELFEAVIDRYLEGYVKRVAAIADDTSHTAMQRLEALLHEMEQSAQDYFYALRGDKLHWTVQYALHEKTMQAILPAVERMTESALRSGEVKSRLNVDARTLSAVLLKGTEAILHARPMENLSGEAIAKLKSSVREYITLLLVVE